MKNEFIPVWQFAKERGISIFTIYSWIKRRQIKEEDVKVDEKIVKRITVNKNAEIRCRKSLVDKKINSAKVS